MSSTHRDERIERLRDTVDTWFDRDDPGMETLAIIEAAFLMAAADGEISTHEHEQLAATIAAVTTEQLAQDNVRRMVDQLAEALRVDGWDARINAVAASLSDPLARRNAFRLAAGVSFVDGEVQSDEERLFGLLAAAFKIPADEASQILVEVRDYLFGEEQRTTTPAPPDDGAAH